MWWQGLFILDVNLINIKQYKSIVFDCDGVVLDSNIVKTEAYFRTAKNLGATDAQAKALMDSEVAIGGMIPKIKACLRATENPSTRCSIIDGNRKNALVREIEEGNTGTLIYNPEGELNE